MFKNKKVLLTIVSSIIVLALAVGLYFIYKYYKDSQVEEGEKEITIVVVDNTGDEEYSKTYTFKTDHEFLGQLLDEKMDIKAETHPDFGRFIIAVDDRMRSETSYWAIYVNDDYASFGMDEQPIKDGDVIKLELTSF